MEYVNNRVEENQRVNNEIKKMVLKQTKLTKKQIDEYMAKDSFFSAQEALKLGIIDKIINNFGDLKVKNW
jgi:ATP-dependent protease ClpP protease subunit